MFSSLRRLFVRVRIQSGRRVRQIPVVRPAIDRLEERLAPAASPFAIGSPAGLAPLIRLFDSEHRDLYFFFGCLLVIDSRLPTGLCRRLGRERISE